MEFVGMVEDDCVYAKQGNSEKGRFTELSLRMIPDIVCQALKLS